MTDQDEATSIALKNSTKERLDELKEHEKESYDSVVSRIASDQPETEVDLDDVMNQLSMAGDPTVDIDVDGLMAELKKTQELIESVPDRTAENVEGRLR